MAQVARGDDEAFACLVERLLDGVHGYLRRLTGSAADADELAQETWLRVWTQPRSYRPGRGRVSTWVYRIAHNLAVDRIRARRGEADPVEDAWPDVDAAGEPAGPEQDHVRQEQHQQVRHALAGLPQNQRSALMLCQIHGFSNAQAADILGVQLRALESLLARARDGLRRQLESQTP